MKELIDEFVCVRLVKANGLDLTLFQFDYDLTFAVFFMNADKTVYGRFGTRSSVDDATKDISLQGLAASMQAALAIHQGYPGNRESLAGKQAVASDYKTANDFPTLRGKYGSSLDYPGAVTKSCMHCHQVRDAERQVYRDDGQPIPDPLLFPNPLPDVVGLEFDPAEASTIARVAAGSSAASAGFEPGDKLVTLAGQPIISLADVQWVLHHAPASGNLAAVVNRNEQALTLQLPLVDDWRRGTDISWRVTSWPLRRMVTGGLLFEPATAGQRRDANVDKSHMALFVKHVGQYGAHAAAMKAGFQKGDIVVRYDGRDENMSPSQLLAYGAQHTKPGQRVPVVVVRDGERHTFYLPMQK